MRPLLLTLLILGLISVPAATAAEHERCDGTATVSWRNSSYPWTVEAAVVDLPGCPDGQNVGLQLITDVGDVPAEPLVDSVEDERVTFDLSSYALPVEPVTGVRVFLYGQEEEELLEILVDQRFFNRAGNEQIGLREMTVLRLAPDDEYRVADAPQRYEEVACADVGVAAGPDVVEEGAGAFIATASGRHIVCYQQETGGQRQDSSDDDTEVLGEALTRDDTSAEDGGGADGSPLPLSGANALGAAGFAVALLALGSIMLRRRES